MEYFIVGIVAFVVGWRLGMEVHARIFAKMLEELGVTEEALDRLLKNLKKEQGKEEPEASQEEIEEELLEEIPIKIEQHQGQLYAFRVDNDAFLGQGADRESLIKRLTETMNGVRLTVSEENGSRYIRETS